MKAIQLFIFIFGIQTGFTQTINTDKVYQFYKSFKTVEDSIATRINLQNTIIYKTCEGHAAFYLFYLKGKPIPIDVAYSIGGIQILKKTELE